MNRIGLNVMYSFNKVHALIGFHSTNQNLEKRHIELYGVRLYKVKLQLLLIKDECTQRMFYGVEIRENRISEAIGYDDIRKQLAV